MVLPVSFLSLPQDTERMGVLKEKKEGMIWGTLHDLLVRVVTGNSGHVSNWEQNVLGKPKREEIGGGELLAMIN